MANFEKVFDLEMTVKQSKAVLPLSTNPGQALEGLKGDRKRLNEALASLTLEEMEEYGKYRLTRLQG